MSVNRTKVLEVAQKHLAKGNYDRAIAEYRKLVEDDPRDVRTWLKIGDLYTRKGARREACETYTRVAEHYAKQGFFLKAVAVYKQILKLDAGRLDISLRLAEMYEQLQLVSDALQTYETVAGALARAGDIDRALATLGKMADLDPENIPVRIKYAEALSKAGRTDQAASEFERGATLLRDQGRHEDYLKVAERLLFHRPKDVKLARELAETYLERNDAKRALAKLQLCFKANPKDIATLELLAQAFHLLGQTPKTISVYREIARIYQEGKKPEERARILSKILELDPSDAEARQALAGYASPREVSRRMELPGGAVVSAPPPASAASARGGAAPVAQSRPAQTHPAQGPAPSPLAQQAPSDVPAVLQEYDDEPELEVAEADSTELEVIDDDEVMILDEDAVPELEPIDEPVAVPAEVAALDQAELESDTDLAAEQALDALESPSFDEDAAAGPDVEIDVVEAPLPGPELRPSVAPDVAREAQIARLLTECDVFLRYGLRDKVIAQLEEVLGLDPQHVEARERLKDAYIEAARTDDAVDQLLALATIFDQQDKSQVGQLYLRQVLDLDPQNLEARRRLGETASSASRAPAPPAAPEAIDPLAGDDDVLFVDDDGEPELVESHDSLTGVSSAPPMEDGPEPVTAQHPELSDPMEFGDRSEVTADEPRDDTMRASVEELESGETASSLNSGALAADFEASELDADDLDVPELELGDALSQPPEPLDVEDLEPVPVPLERPQDPTPSEAAFADAESTFDAEASFEAPALDDPDSGFEDLGLDAELPDVRRADARHEDAGQEDSGRGDIGLDEQSLEDALDDLALDDAALDDAALDDAALDDAAPSLGPAEASKRGRGSAVADSDDPFTDIPSLAEPVEEGEPFVEATATDLERPRTPVPGTSPAPLASAPEPSADSPLPPAEASPASDAPPEMVPTDPGLAPMSPEEFEAVPVRPSVIPQAVEEAEQRLSMPPGEIEESLDEVDFFLAQGLHEEAREIVEDLLERHPGHPVLQDKLGEIAEAEAASRVAQQQSVPPMEDESFALAEKLAEELGPVEADPSGSDVLDVENVFEQFKKGVEEQIGLEDSDTHFDLGIAYKEMGLLEDAVHEFQLAMRNPQRECISHTMIGLIHVEQGQVQEGIKHFKNGLYADAKTEREELGLYYELGNAYELMGDPKEAVYYFQKVQKRDPDFRRVSDRIERLTSPEPPAAPTAPQMTMDDVDAAFDDLLGRDD